jgi:hypothetical protein
MWDKFSELQLHLCTFLISRSKSKLKKLRSIKLRITTSKKNQKQRGVRK